MSDGIILLDKKPGITSMASDNFIKKQLGTKKVGHLPTTTIKVITVRAFSERPQRHLIQKVNKSEEGSPRKRSLLPFVLLTISRCGMLSSRWQRLLPRSRLSIPQRR